MSTQTGKLDHRSASMPAPSERHGPAPPPSPDVEVAADTPVFTANAERAVTEGHGHASRCAPGPSLQERHGSEADDRRVAPCEIVVTVEAQVRRNVHSAQPGQWITHLDAVAAAAGLH